MNKDLFTKLYKEAHITETTYPAGCNGYPDMVQVFSAEKFAELIVKACADAADMAQGVTPYIGDYVGEQMGCGIGEGIAAWRAKE